MEQIVDLTTILDVLFNPHVAPRRSNDCRWQNISFKINMLLQNLRTIVQNYKSPT